LQRREDDRWKQQAAAVIDQRQQIAKPQGPSQLLHQRIESLAEKLPADLRTERAVHTRFHRSHANQQQDSGDREAIEPRPRLGMPPSDQRQHVDRAENGRVHEDAAGEEEPHRLLAWTVTAEIIHFKCTR
jgi:hypothetical protein